ncbi:MAG: S-adenosylmethionine:tRNA ribosyltransferase-isomerase [Chloroflexota bacterium]
MTTQLRTNAPLDSMEFHLPPHLEAGEPPEARGLARDEVRLMVSFLNDNRIVHTRFRNLTGFMRAGDVLVINTSGTMNASLRAQRSNGMTVELHLSTHLPGDLWTVEVRVPEGGTTTTLQAALEGEMFALPGGGSSHILAPYDCGCGRRSSLEHPRLWLARLVLPDGLFAYLARHGSPIRYGYVEKEWPGAYYQTVYATEPGSAEMPSAGRPFTADLLTRLMARGVIIAPLLLHTGVASLESHEPPYEEYYRVPPETAHLATRARRAGKKIVAVGTTVVRALETVTDADGQTYPGEGWTCTVVTPADGIRSANALLTGFHEPRSSHLAMLEALAGREHLRLTYSAAIDEGYLWHEFGDLHLILPCGDATGN